MGCDETDLSNTECSALVGSSTNANSSKQQVVKLWGLMQVSHVKASFLGLRCSLQDREMMSLLQQWCQFTSAWLIYTATGVTPSQVCELQKT